MTNEELKALALAAIDQEKLWKDAGEPWPMWNTRLIEMQAAANPAAVLGLIADNERLRANVKLNLCDYPAIHRGDVDLLISFIGGTSQTELAEKHGCTPPNISRKIRRVKARLGWKKGMGAVEINARAEQLRALASQGAVVTADLMAERDALKAECEGLRNALIEIRENSIDLSACEFAADALIDARKGGRSNG